MGRFSVALETEILPATSGLLTFLKDLRVFLLVKFKNFLVVSVQFLVLLCDQMPGTTGVMLSLRELKIRIQRRKEAFMSVAGRVFVIFRSLFALILWKLT